MKFEPLWALVAGAEDKGNIPLAIRFATQLIELEDSVEARMARARLLAMISEIRAAISDLTHAMSKQPENLEALFARAHCFLAERVFELAEADFERGIGIDPKNKYFLDAYARCLARQTSDSAIVLAFEAPFGVLLEQRCQTREPQEITEARLCEDDSAADYAPSAPALGPIANDSLPAGVSYWRPGPPDEPDPYDESLERITSRP